MFVIEHHNRHIHLADVTAHPTGHMDSPAGPEHAMDQAARADGLKLLIRDRDTKFTAALDA